MEQRFIKIMYDKKLIDFNSLEYNKYSSYTIKPLLISLYYGPGASVSGLIYATI